MLELLNKEKEKKKSWKYHFAVNKGYKVSKVPFFLLLAIPFFMSHVGKWRSKFSEITFLDHPGAGGRGDEFF